MCGAGDNLRLILDALRRHCARIGPPMQAVIAALIAIGLGNCKQLKTGLFRAQ